MICLPRGVFSSCRWMSTTAACAPDASSSAVIDALRWSGASCLAINAFTSAMLPRWLPLLIFDWLGRSWRGLRLASSGGNVGLGAAGAGLGGEVGVGVSLMSCQQPTGLRRLKNSKPQSMPRLLPMACRASGLGQKGIGR